MQTIEQTLNNNHNEVPRGLVMILATACGLSVANLYYNQPLLLLFSETFQRTSDEISLIPCLIQIAYAIGLIIFVPLGDRLNRHKLILGLLITNLIGSVLSAIAPTFAIFVIATVFIGLTCVSTQLIIPIASLIAPPHAKGKIVGAVLSGLFAGILLARTVSGFVGEYAGWRAMYWLAAGLDIVLLLLIYNYLPRIKPMVTGSYFSLLRSLWELFRQKFVLREACITGLLLFAAFNALWGSLAFLLSQPPYQFGSDLVGLFGLVGVVGMMASARIGQMVDRFGGRQIIIMASALIAIAFIFIWYAQFHLWSLITGVILLDLGSRSGLVSNQIRIFALAPEASSRLNTVFMSFYFIGGALGAQLGAMAGAAGWFGIATVGGGLALAVVIMQLIVVRNKIQPEDYAKESNA